MGPKQIKVDTKKNNLNIKWKDGTESSIDIKYLRDECPCANCKGETILFKTYRPKKSNVEKPEMYEIKDIKMTGGYGIQITWKDGHDTGIYNWEYLRDLDNDQGTDKKHDYDNLI